MSTLSTWWFAIRADAELAGESIPDDATVLHYSGNGMTVVVNASDMDAAMRRLHRADEVDAQVAHLRTLIKNIEDYCYNGEHANVMRVARLCEDALEGGAE